MGESCSPACFTNLEKKMDKKMYFEPEMVVVELELQGMLASSPSSPEVPQGGGEGEEETGGWGYSISAISFRIPLKDKFENHQGRRA